MMRLLVLMNYLFFLGWASNQYSNLLPVVFKTDELRKTHGGDLVTAVYEVVDGFPTKEICICFDKSVASPDFIQELARKLVKNDIAIKLFNITTQEVQEKYFDFLEYQVTNHFGAYSIFFCNHKLFEHILLEVYDRDYIRRNVIYIFNWGRKPFNKYFIQNIQRPMKVYVITNPREDAFRIFYNQALPQKTHHLEMVNWWHQGVGLFNHPTLPAKYNSIYKNFKGKVFDIPVIHKPPWHFVEYVNNSIRVLGGRDDRILSLLSEKLNFGYQYWDPPERSQGSSASENGTFKGVLGLVWKRQAEFFIGDVALTLERSNYVEFSFITLADSGAFITHAPSKLNEALALLRPFHWQVWPAIGVTFIVVGPVLYAIIALPNAWRPQFRVRSHCRLLFDCTWFTTTVLLKQNTLYSVIMSFETETTWTLSLNMHIEKAINNLDQLERAMRFRGYDLYVERHSSFYSLLENGTGVYKKLWQMMNKQQSHFLLQSVEQGVQMVRDHSNKAVIAGRETLFFDIQRFGPSNFHLSEKLNTAYSAIAFQLGCPYIEEVNRILMAIFEAGIITKMTENEYENLGRQKETSTAQAENDDLTPNVQKENRRVTKVSEDNEKLKPISIKMLQGTFYLLCIGNVFSGLILAAEIAVHRHKNRFGRTRRRKMTFVIRKTNKFIISKIGICVDFVKTNYRRMMNDAYVATLDYIE